MRYYCNCGLYFGKAMQLREHIALGNPRWPRRDPDDRHRAVSKEEWDKHKCDQYRSLREG